MTLGTSDVQLTIAEKVLLAPAGTAQWLIAKAIANNQDAASHTITLHRVPAGGTPDATNIIVAPFPLLAGETLALPLSAQAVLGGQSLRGLCSADNVVNVNITYEVVR